MRLRRAFGATRDRRPAKTSQYPQALIFKLSAQAAAGSQRHGTSPIEIAIFSPVVGPRRRQEVQRFCASPWKRASYPDRFSKHHAPLLSEVGHRGQERTAAHRNPLEGVGAHRPFGDQFKPVSVRRRRSAREGKMVHHASMPCGPEDRAASADGVRMCLPRWLSPSREHTPATNAMHENAFRSWADPNRILGPRVRSRSSGQVDRPGGEALPRSQLKGSRS
jgi:hypothetical protein